MSGRLMEDRGLFTGTALAILRPGQPPRPPIAFACATRPA